MENNSIKKNALLNIIYNILNIIFPLITFPYVSRVLMAEKLGNVTFFSTVANYAVMLASLGISTYGVRSVARVRDDKRVLSKTTFELLVINTIATIIVLAVLLLSSVFIRKFSAEPILLTINSILIFATPFGMNWLYSGLEQYGYITKRSIAVKLISVLLVFLLVKNQNDYCVYAAIVSFSTVGAYVFNLIYARRFISFRAIDRLRFRQHFRPMMILFASALAISVYISLDTIMLGFISGDKEVGLYTVAVKVKTLLLITVNAISTVLLPRLSYYIANKMWSDFQRILEKSISTIFMISLPLVVFFIIEAEDSVLFLGGNEYISAAACMAIIMPILLISGFSNITGNQILIPLGKENCFMKAVVSGALVDIVLNYMLMPRLGSVGAAIATLIAECTQLSIQVFFSRSYVFPAIQWKTIRHVVIATAVASMILLYFRYMMAFDSFIKIIVCATIFFILYGVILLIMKEKLLYGYWRDLKKLIHL